MQADRAVGATLPTFDFDAKDLPQDLAARTLPSHVGTGQEALERRAADLPMSGAMVFLVIQAWVARLSERQAGLAFQHGEQPGLVTGPEVFLSIVDEAH